MYIFIHMHTHISIYITTHFLQITVLMTVLSLNGKSTISWDHQQFESERNCSPAKAGETFYDCKEWHTKRTRKYNKVTAEKEVTENIKRHCDCTSAEITKNAPFPSFLSVCTGTNRQADNIDNESCLYYSFYWEGLCFSPGELKLTFSSFRVLTRAFC